MPVSRRIDQPGLLFAIMGGAAFLLPFLQFRPNRIVLGEAVALPPAAIAVLSLCLVVGALRLPHLVRLAAGVIGVAVMVFLAGSIANDLGADAPPAARVSPSGGLWLGLGAFALLAADALSRMRLSLTWRAVVLVGVCAAAFAALASGHLAQLSVMREYAARQDVFAQQAVRHLALAFGSLLAAVAVGLPVGLMLHRRAGMRPGVLGALNLMQTTPSLALFGMMIPLLSWVAATVPAAATIGVAGIGVAPALIALFLYSLLPVVGNTVVGLDNVSVSARDAARGMGMTDRQVMTRVSIPLAAPVVLAAVRIVLVQNIGLAVIAGLIGGGGFGTFVFQGLNQTATDLILLGAIPTVALALVAGIALDLVTEALQ